MKNIQTNDSYNLTPLTVTPTPDPASENPVQNSLTPASTTKAPSVDAVNTALSNLSAGTGGVVKSYVDNADTNLQNQINNRYNKSEVDAKDTALQNQIDTKANDNNVVHLTGNESITGNKTFTGNATANKFIGDGSLLTNVPGVVTLPPMIIDLVGYQFNPIATTAANTGLASSIVIGSDFMWDSNYAIGKTVRLEICSAGSPGKTLAAALYDLAGNNVQSSGISGYQSAVSLIRSGTFTLINGTTYQVRIAVGTGTGYLYSARLIIS